MLLDEGDLPTRSEDSTEALRIRLTDWFWAFVFSGVEECADASSKTG
jgi:hypothetical protein